MKIQKFVLGMMTVTALVSCGQNPSLEKKINKSLDSNITNPLNPNTPNSDENKLISKMKMGDTDLGEIYLGQAITVVLKIENLKPDTVDKINLKLKRTDQILKNITIQSSNEDDEHTFVQATYIPTTLGDKDMKVVAKVQTEGQDLRLDGTITAKVITNSQVKDGLRLYIEDQKNILFDAISMGSTATTDVLIENPSADTAFLETINLEKGTNYSYELVDVVSGTECNKKVSHSCFLRIKYKPTDLSNLEDKLTVTHTYNGKVSKYLIINLRGLIAQDSSVCTESSQRMYFPKVKSKLDSYENIQLPYFVRTNKTNKTVNVLVNQETNTTETYLEDSLSFVQDAQVITSFNLAADGNLGPIRKVEFASSLLKNFDTNNPNLRLTEVMCLENTMTCSGEFFKDSVYKKHINGQYSIINEDFLSILMREGQHIALAGHEFADYNGIMNLNFLGPNVGNAIRGKSNVNIVIADDIKLKKLPALLVEYQKEIHNGCN